MKPRARPAAMEDEDSITGEAIPSTRRSAIFSGTRYPMRKANPNTLGYTESRPLGTIAEVVSRNTNGLLSILAGEHFDNPTVWKGSGQHRVFFCADKVVNGEVDTYVNREILISETDLEQSNPEVMIGQRTYVGSGTLELRAHQLVFGTKIRVNQPYIFFKLGDEIPGVGCPDLHCIFRFANDWEAAARKADISRFDQHVTVKISFADVQADRTIMYDLQNKRLAKAGVKPGVGIEVSAAELFPPPSFPVSKSFYNTSPKKRTVTSGGDDGIRVTPVPRSVTVKMIGVGEKIGDGELKADVNVTFVLTK